jgi:hypothetical protein
VLRLRFRLARLALFARRRYGLVFTLAIGLSVVAGVLTSRLRFDTDVLALLPHDEPVVDNFRLALEEFGSTEFLLVAVRVPEGAVLDPYEAFVDRVGERLGGLEDLAEVEYRLGDLEELMRQFLPTSLLFLGVPELEELAGRLSDEALRARAAELRHLVSTPQALALKRLMTLDPLGLAPMFLDRVTPGQSALRLDWSSGYFLSRDREMLLILAQPTGPPQDIDFGRRMVEAVEREIAAVAEEWPDLAGPDRPPIPETLLAGRYIIALGDDSVIRADVLTNVLTSMGGVLILFLLAFRRLGPLLYAFVPLAFGLLLTFGLSAALFGGLSAATSGTAALLIGLGIDFVIVSYGRFVEERARGATLERALEQMSGSSGRAVVVGAITSAATFYAFGVTDFTGLYQMGYLTGTGILLCMLGVLLLLPAMLSWSEDHHEKRAKFRRLHLYGLGADRWVGFCMDHPRSVLAVGFALTVVAGGLALDLRFEDSVRAMRPEGTPEMEAREEITQRFGAGFDQMVMLVSADSADDVLLHADHAIDAVQPLVANGTLAGVDGVASLLPPPARQAEVLAWLERERTHRVDEARIRTTFLSALEANGLRPRPFEEGLDLFLEAVGRERPLEMEDLLASPQTARLLDRYLLETETGWKSAIYLFPPPGEWRREPPPSAVEIAEELGPHVALTGANVVSKFMRERVLDDAVIAAILGFVLVAILLYLDFGRMRETILSLVPLAMGIVWMLGAMAALEIDMNFMNIFVSTMIIGIGVDYGIHMIHRYRELEGSDRAHMRQGLSETGKAIVLAALSTVVGFGSLAQSHYPGLASMGMVALLGALSTALVAISLLPAWIGLQRSKGDPDND